MLDPSVKVVSSRSTTVLDATTLLPRQETVWTFMVGTHGPFSRSTPNDNFTAAYIEVETQKVVDTLRAAGAL